MAERASEIDQVSYDVGRLYLQPSGMVWLVSRSCVTTPLHSALRKSYHAGLCTILITYKINRTVEACSARTFHEVRT